MTDAEELAERYLALWTQYMTALLADPRTMEMLKRWMELASRFSYPEAGANEAIASPFPAWPPFFSPFGAPAPPVAADAALTRRIDELERRLAALEQKPASRSTRRGARTDKR
ncbi:MAG TPA: hypothetical protein VNV38_08680 [Stellaceae bacterium]|jgi:hypothetical protein|nr:hypothetical protein [Stellaceae bacterium]